MRFLSKTKTDLELQDFAVGGSISLFKRAQPLTLQPFFCCESLIAKITTVFPLQTRAPGDFFIVSCDAFTRAFYANRLGIDLQVACDVKCAV